MIITMLFPWFSQAIVIFPSFSQEIVIHKNPSFHQRFGVSESGQHLGQALRIVDLRGAARGATRQQKRRFSVFEMEMMVLVDGFWYNHIRLVKYYNVLRNETVNDGVGWW